MGLKAYARVSRPRRRLINPYRYHLPMVFAGAIALIVIAVVGAVFA